MTISRIAIIPPLLFILSSIACKNESKSELDKITFHYVDYDIDTPFGVSCDDFEIFFSSSFKTIVVNDKTHLVEFEEYLGHHEILNSVKRIDVRVKIIIAYTNKKTSTLCMDRFNHLILDGKSINSDKKIIDFIKNYIK